MTGLIGMNGRGFFFLMKEAYAYGTDAPEKPHYTYTVITTDSNPQLKFLHDRMPVILDPGSSDLFKWLDPNRHEWNKELQSLLKPFDGELEIYPVSKEVGKVGNNSAAFIVPVDSTENKQNIANFFGSQKKGAGGGAAKKVVEKEEEDVEERGVKVEHVKGEERATVANGDDAEDNAPKPAAPSAEKGNKRAYGDDEDEEDTEHTPAKAVKTETHDTPLKSTHRTRSATSNLAKNKPAVANDGSKKITNFFKS